jgi:hypothetical protein
MKSEEKTTGEVVADRKPPREWAIAKGLLRVASDGRVEYRKHTPWEYEATCRLKRWPDPMLDPTFAITEAEFVAAIAEMHATSVPKAKS